MPQRKKKDATKMLFVFPNLCIYLQQVLVVAHEIFICRMWALSWGMWGLVPWLGIEPGPSVLGHRISHWTTREVPAQRCLLTWYIEGPSFLWQIQILHFLFTQPTLTERLLCVRYSPRDQGCNCEQDRQGSQPLWACQSPGASCSRSLRCYGKL